MTPANDNDQDFAAEVQRVIASLSEARVKALNAAAIQIREWREEDRRNGITWNDERVSR